MNSGTTQMTSVQQSRVKMECAKIKQSLLDDAGEDSEQRATLKELETDKKTFKGSEETEKTKSHKLRFKSSVDGTNSENNNKQLVHIKRQLPHRTSKRTSGKYYRTECWRLDYKPSNDKHEVLEKLKQEIYEKNIQRELELQMKSRIGLRSVTGYPKNVAMVSRIGQNGTFFNCFSRTRDEIPSRNVCSTNNDYKKERKQSPVAPEVKGLRVKSNTRLRANKTCKPKSGNRVVVDIGMSSVAPALSQERNKSFATRSSHVHRNSEEIPKETGEKSSEKMPCNESRHQYSSNKSVTTNEILEKYFSSSVFPPLSSRSTEDREREDSIEHDSSLKKCFNPESTSARTKEQAEDQEAQPEPEENITKKNILVWKKESYELRKKIKAFVEKPVPELPPASLMIHRRSTVADISLGAFSKASPATAHAQPPERKKSIGAVNIHTCPNLNVFTDRSWMYQDRRAEKCRYIRTPQTPIPPISEIFQREDEIEL